MLHCSSQIRSWCTIKCIEENIQNTFNMSKREQHPFVQEHLEKLHEIDSVCINRRHLH